MDLRSWLRRPELWQMSQGDPPPLRVAGLPPECVWAIRQGRDSRDFQEDLAADGPYWRHWRLLIRVVTPHRCLKGLWRGPEKWCSLQGTILTGKQNQCKEDASLQGASLASQLLSSVEGTVCLRVRIWGPGPLTPLLREGSLSLEPDHWVADYDRPCQQNREQA